MKTKLEVVVYQTAEGVSPFETWLGKLKDRQAKVQVLRRVQRVALENFGNNKWLGCQEGNKVVLLLCAGDKRTQAADIERAREYRADYERRKR